MPSWQALNKRNTMKSDDEVNAQQKTHTHTHKLEEYTLVKNESRREECLGNGDTARQENNHESQDGGQLRVGLPGDRTVGRPVGG